MNICILDGYAANPGDLSWEPLSTLGTLSIYERSRGKEILERAQHQDALLINKTILNRETLLQLPRLKYIGYLATGYNTVDLPTVRELGITLTNAVGYSSASVAQHAIALMLELSNQVAIHAVSVLKGEWTRNPDWTYRLGPLTEWKGKSMGIVGLGNIGTQTARIAQAFGMKILAHNRNPKREIDWVEWLELDELFSRSDVISLHCPLTEENAGIVNARRLSLMKSSAILINTARGQLINEKELAEALESGIISGAALDVLSSEPPSADNPLLGAANCIITPHIAWGSRESRQRLIQLVAGNLKAFKEGRRLHVVE